MSGSRDADVLVETVDALAERFAGQYPKTFFARRQAAAGRARPRAAQARPTPPRTPTRSRGLAQRRVAAARARRRRRWPARCSAPTPAAARRSRAADRKPTATNLHEWRKRVKDLWYQQRLLEDTWPGVMKAQAKEAKKLSKLLGEDHDLAVLAEHVDDARAPRADRRAPRRAARASRATLGRRIYAERPKAFARRARRYVDLAAACAMEVERKYLLAARPDGLDGHESGAPRAGLPRARPGRRRGPRAPQGRQAHADGQDRRRASPAARRRSRSTPPTSTACGR